jgi:predicted RNA-binding Zn-ribbon protein involved in translation (DUF1610 family)
VAWRLVGKISMNQHGNLAPRLMLSPSRGPERLMRQGQWLIALLFAYFLIQVGGSLIADLPLLSRRPPQERFLDTARVGELERQLQPLQHRRDQLQGAIERLTEQSQQNPEVIARARQLDQRLREQQQLSAQRSQLEQLAPQQLRQRQIRYEKALEALGRHQCPSCERSLPRQEGALPNYCMHCGLQLQRHCAGCGNQHLASFPYCPSCGLAAQAEHGTEPAVVPSP